MNNYSKFFKALGFVNHSANLWARTFEYFSQDEYTITVDIENQVINYPEPLVLGDKTTSDFVRDENFVVLECVCRLLEKGYDPATIILEKRYKLGRGASGGKSDITILQRALDSIEQKSAPALLIIECKTSGKEHENEKKKTIDEGGQLFGYLQNDRSAKYLCIYSSLLREDLNNTFEYRSDIIHVEDSSTAKDRFSKKEKTESLVVAKQLIPLYENAYNREMCHEVWKKTYNASFQTLGIFEKEFTPYAIRYSPLRRKDLKEFSLEEGSAKVFNSFMEILRHNNVSDKENAFNRLCAIILAKLVDEERGNDEILDFQFFPNKDTSEDLIDRLQHLYKSGMKDSLGEDITYFDERDIDNAFMAHRRDMARNEVKKIFRALKFYSNNDFAFKEVHNKKLFEQNAQVVKEVVLLLQDFRFKYTSKQAFLGNLFELLLSSGFKQSEGQFFTPIPITRFIVRSLPLKEKIAAAHKKGSQQVLPRVIDYACGSAHFLTEIVEEIQDDINDLNLPQKNSTSWTRDCIWGVEKDYRLARTAKISMFLHGAGDTNIFHDDGLDHSNPLLPAPGTVDVIVANPPYAVKSFKQHLQINNKFELINSLTPKSNEIEVLFVERTAQLLCIGGVAGLVLPLTIFSNPGAHQLAREFILRKFLIRGIVELSGAAFIETKTKTAVLFLERRSELHFEHFTLRANALFDEHQRPNDDDYADTELLKAYCNSASVGFEYYLKWLTDPSNEVPTKLASSDLFKWYIRDFEKLVEIINRKEDDSFTSLSASLQKAEMKGKLFKYCRKIEKKKFIYFSLAYAEGLNKGQLDIQNTTIFRNIGNTEAKQSCLGYKWSERRGKEGMINLQEPFNGGVMFTPGSTKRKEPKSKVAHYFRKAFLGEVTKTPSSEPLLKDKLRVIKTFSLFEFAETSLDLVFNIKEKTSLNSIQFNSKYKLVRLDLVAKLEYGKPLPKKNRIDGEYPVMGSNGKIGNHNSSLIKGPAVIVGRKGSAGKVTYIEKDCFPIDTTFYVSHDKKETELRYLELVLQILNLEDQAKALGVPGLNRNDVYKLKIPLPPMDVQKAIVTELVALEEKAKTIVINDIAKEKQSILFNAIR